MASKFTIVCFGDSLVEGEGDEQKRNGWVGRLQEMLPANINPNRCRVLNLGIGGDTIRDLEYRIGEVLLRNPDVVILGCGTNDIFIFDDLVHEEGIEERRVSYYLSHRSWQHVLDVLKASIPKVLVMQMLLPKEVDKIRKHGAEKWNNFIGNLCAERNIPFLEVNNMDTEKHFNPCLHPNATGYTIYAEQVYNFIEENKWLPDELQGNN